MIWRTDLSYLINVPQQELFRAQAKERAGSGFWRPALRQCVEMRSNWRRRHADPSLCLASFGAARFKFLDIFLAKTEAHATLISNEDLEIERSGEMRTCGLRPQLGTRAEQEDEFFYSKRP